MAVALERFYEGDDAKWKREVEVFRTCSDKTGRMLRWSRANEDSIEELRDMALSRGGLFNESMRFKAWRELLGIRPSDLTTLKARRSPTVPDTEELDIIRKDVQRSAMFRSKAVKGSIAKGQQDSQSLESKLTSILMATVSGVGAEDATARTKEKPCYYQGLHDVAFVLLQNLNYDELAATAAFQKVVQTHLKDATRKDFSNVFAVLDSFLLPLIHSLDIQLYQALIESEVPLSNAVLPWLITLFSHPVHDDAVASRLMDAFLAHPHPMLPFYVAVAILLHHSFREQLLESAFDPATMQMTIQGLPGQLKNDFAEVGDDAFAVTAQDIIESALQIMHQNPPESLLRFVGVGLKKRTRRRLIRRMHGIAMLQMPEQGREWLGLGALSELILPKRLIPSAGLAVQKLGRFISSKASDGYNTASATAIDMRSRRILDCSSSKVVDFSKDTLVTLQTVALFLLMPVLRADMVYNLMEGLWGWLSCLSWNMFDDEETKETTSNLELAMKLCDYTELRLEADEELGMKPPGMVPSDSSPSLLGMEIELDASDSSNMLYDMDEVPWSEWSIDEYDDLLVV